MKSNAAILYGLEQPFKVEEIEVEEPKANEVLVRIAASGICHSDHHFVTGDLPMAFPLLLGHEGAGVVEQVGPGVTTVAPGDHVVLSPVPSCGHCKWCASGQTGLCDLGAALMLGPMLDGTYRHWVGDQGVGKLCMLGTFSQYTVVPDASAVKIPSDVPLEVACLVGCGVSTGYGAAVRRGRTRAGDVVIVFGVGGVGTNAVQGAATAGARAVIAVDPIAFRRESALKFGATHAVNPEVEDPVAVAQSMTNGQGADVAVMTVGVLTPELVGQGVASVAKGGRVVCVAIPPMTETHVNVVPFELILYQKEVVGCLFGGLNPFADVNLLLDLYKAGKLKLDELVTRRYPLEDINTAFSDMLTGRNVRGVIDFN